jgi:parallel beta-helix repeat protein
VRTDILVSGSKMTGYDLWRGKKVRVAAVTVSFIVSLATSALATLSPAGSAAAGLSHSPIEVNSSSDLTTENGVIGGSGTAADPYIIAGWEVGLDTDIGFSTCISINNVDAHLIIRDVQLQSRYVGVHLWNCSNVSVMDSDISNSVLDAVGIHLSRNITVTNCNITSTGDYRSHGMRIWESSCLSITGNRFEGRGVFFDTEDMNEREDWYSSHVFTDNTLNGLPLVYRNNVPNLAIQQTTVGQVIVANCSSARIDRVAIDGGDAAISVFRSDDVEITECTLSRNYVGVYAFSSPGCDVKRNNITNGLHTGIWLRKGCNDSHISDNVITGNDLASIDVEMCSCTISHNIVSDGGGVHVGFYVSPIDILNNTVRDCYMGIFGVNMYSGGPNITGNDVSGCKWGIRTDLCIEAVVSENVLLDNEYGVFMTGSVNCTVQRNQISDCDFGIYLTQCYGVVVRDNTLTNNTVQTFDDSKKDNSWDNDQGIPDIYLYGTVAAVALAALVAFLLYRRRKAASVSDEESQVKRSDSQ